MLCVRLRGRIGALVDYPMRARGRTDANQEAIVRALRSAGMCVQSLAAMGGGVPDLLVGWRSHNFLLEVKDGNKPPSARALTVAEQNWHDQWGGSVVTVCTPDDAVGAILGMVD